MKVIFVILEISTCSFPLILLLSYHDIYLSIKLGNYPSTHSPTQLTIYQAIHSQTHYLPTYPSAVHKFIYALIHLFIYPPVDQPIYPFSFPLVKKALFF